jgi:hypothetical protein
MRWKMRSEYGAVSDPPSVCHREKQSDVAIHLLRSVYSLLTTRYTLVDQMDCRLGPRSALLAMTRVYTEAGCRSETRRREGTKRGGRSTTQQTWNWRGSPQWRNRCSECAVLGLLPHARSTVCIS